MKKFNFKFMLIAVLSIVILFSLSMVVNASQENIAKIGEKEYATLEEAIKDVPKNNTQTTITLLRDVQEGSGFKVHAGQNIVIDFANFTYDASIPTVGSAGTETNGCQLLKDSTIIMKNGTLTSRTASILIQNYSNLTLEDMIVDGTKSNKCAYVASNNNGKVNIIGNTSIIGNNFAFDMCWAPENGYPDGTQITVDTTGTIKGNIELGLWGAFSDKNGIKSTLNIKNINHVGKFVVDKKLVNQLTIEGGKFTSDVNEYVKDGYITLKNSENEYQVGLKATDLTIEENITLKVGDTKKIDVKVKPIGTIENVEFASNNKDVVTVDDEGNIKAVKIGEAIITVKVGDITKECKVKVNAKDILVDLPTIDENNKDLNIGISEEVQKEIDKILKDEATNNKEVQEALEAGKDVKVEIQINKLNTTSVDKEDKKEIDELVLSGTIAQYFDINLLITVDGNKIGTIPSPSKELTFTLNIPEELIKDGRTFYVVRVHNGKAEKIEGILENGKFTFKTDKFSTYALAYEDKTVEESTDEKDDTPKTGVTNNIALVAIVATISLAGAVILRKRK